MHDSEIFSPYPPKPECFQTCVQWEVSQALSGCVSASIQSGACQAVSGLGDFSPCRECSKEQGRDTELRVTEAALSQPG